tara:strand:- start:375 stop:596 length:222 start_codon:yes stop_codon:yes gene_type:complete
MSTKDKDDNEQIMFKDEDGNIQIIDKHTLQLLEFDIDDVLPNKKGGQIKKKKKKTKKKKPRGWGKARYKGTKA